MAADVMESYSVFSMAIENANGWPLTEMAA